MTLIALSSVYDAFAQAARDWPDRPVFNVLERTASIYEIEPGEISYGQALDNIDGRADAFATAGYGAGMRVGLLLENRPEFFLIWLALNRLGASVVPINPDLRASELEYLIGHAEPALIVAIEKRHVELRSAAQAAGVDLDVISPGETPGTPRANAVVAEPLDGSDRETAVLYTSGTTGAPKGCVLPGSYFLHAGDWYRNLGGIAELTLNGERMITPLPVFHMNAMACSFMGMIAVGGCLTILDRFHPTTWWQDVRAAKATCLHYLGVMPSMLMNAPAKAEDHVHHIRFGLGAGVDPKLQARFEARFGFPLVEAWAMTETGVGAVISAQQPDRLVGEACLGLAADGVETRVIDDAGAPITEGQPGELLVRRAGANPKFGFFSHYYKNPAATEEAWDGGWFHTGDIVRQDGVGRFFFVDRKKNVIRRSGENIAAAEVESVLMRHPAVQAAGVAPVPDTLRGDEVFACLVVQEDTPRLAESIADWALDQMAYYKVPGYIAFVEALPLTSTQKIQRAALKSKAVELLQAGQAYDFVHLKKRQVA